MSLELSDVVTELLGELASNADGYIVLRREVGGVTDDITGDYTPGTNTDYDIVGAATQISDGLVDGSRIQSGDVMVTMDNQVEPLLTDQLLIGGVEYQMVGNPKVINHAGIVQGYKVQARK